MQSNINKHFGSFIKTNENIEENNRVDIELLWNSKENQKALEKIINKAKKKKRKDGPKKAKSPYLFFCEDERPKIKKQKPDLNPTQTLSECGMRWKLISDKPKQIKKYQDLFVKDKERYEKEMENYTPSDDSDDSDAKTKKKKNNGLKKNKTPYLYFCEDERIKIKEEGLNINPKDMFGELSKRWKEFQNSEPDELEKYKKMAAEDKTRYETDKKNLESETELEIAEEVEVEVAEEVVEEKKKSSPKKSDEKKRSNGFVNFGKEKRAEVKDENSALSAKEINKVLSDMWKELSDEEKAEYNTK
jgi:hypothetical protein